MAVNFNKTKLKWELDDFKDKTSSCSSGSEFLTHVVIY